MTGVDEKAAGNGINNPFPRRKQFDVTPFTNVRAYGITPLEDNGLAAPRDNVRSCDDTNRSSANDRDWQVGIVHERAL